MTQKRNRTARGNHKARGAAPPSPPEARAGIGVVTWLRAPRMVTLQELRRDVLDAIKAARRVPCGTAPPRFRETVTH